MSSRWRGRTPDPVVKRKLDVGTGHAQVPEPMLHQGLPDLGVLVWAQLRLWFDDRPGRTTYRELADALGMAELSDKAAELRLWKAVSAMRAAGLIERARLRDNQVTYRAITGEFKRWAVVRRRDIAQLSTGYLDGDGRLNPVTPAHLCDFARWQLECRDRGWCAEATAEMASRWSVSARTFRTRRDALHAVGLIRVMRRSGHPDLIWLGELVDTHWMIPSEVDDDTTDRAESGSKPTPQTVAENEGSGSRKQLGRVAESEGSTLAEVERSPWQKTRGPKKESLPSDLTVVLPDLGGASATPLALVTRELGDAAPQAAPSRNLDNDSSAAPRHVASRLISEHRYLVQAPPHFRAAMLRRLVRAINAGLDERHLARALARVVGHADRDAHCELVRLAVQQAWADQRSGTCPECAAGRGVDAHGYGCSARSTAHEVDDSTAIAAAIAASLASARSPQGAVARAVPDPSQGAAVVADPLGDPLGKLLDHPAGEPPDWTGTPDEELVAWLTAGLARLVAPTPAEDRLRALQRAWASWRPHVPTDRRDLLDAAALRVRLRLETHRTPARRAS